MKSRLFISLVILALLALTLYLLDIYGKGKRTIPHSWNTEVLTFQEPRNIYNHLRAKGQKGRVLVSLSPRFYFMTPEREIIPPRSDFPIKVFNPVEKIKRELKSDNFLRICIETGLIREIVHVLPEKVFREKLESARNIEGVRIKDGVIEYPYFGSPRYIMRPQSFKNYNEPVILFISAVMMRYMKAGEVYKWIREKGIRPDYILILLSGDGLELSQAEIREIERLRMGEDY